MLGNDVYVENKSLIKIFRYLPDSSCRPGLERVVYRFRNQWLIWTAASQCFVKISSISPTIWSHLYSFSEVLPTNFIKKRYGKPNMYLSIFFVSSTCFFSSASFFSSSTLTVRNCVILSRARFWIDLFLILRTNAYNLISVGKRYVLTFSIRDLEKYSSWTHLFFDVNILYCPYQ